MGSSAIVPADRVEAPVAATADVAAGAHPPHVPALGASSDGGELPGSGAPENPAGTKDTIHRFGPDPAAPEAAAERTRVEWTIEAAADSDEAPAPIIASGETPGSMTRAAGTGPRVPEVGQDLGAGRTLALGESVPQSNPASSDPSSSDPFAGLTTGVPAGEPGGFAPSAVSPEPSGSQRAAPFPVPQPPAIQVAATIVQRASAPIEGLRLQLEPGELGTVEIEVSTGERRRARAVVLVERPETLELLLREQRSIERILAASGLDLPAGGLELGLRQEGGNRRGALGRADRTATAPTASGSAEPPPAPRLLSLRLLDLVI